MKWGELMRVVILALVFDGQVSSTFNQFKLRVNENFCLADNTDLVIVVRIFQIKQMFIIFYRDLIEFARANDDIVHEIAKRYITVNIIH